MTTFLIVLFLIVVVIGLIGLGFVQVIKVTLQGLANIVRAFRR